MAIKNGSYDKFKAIQANNEEIAQKDFAGMRRTPAGWSLTGSTANSILGGKPLLQAGGKGAKILDLASTEPQPQTTEQAILKAAGKWKPLNEHYGISDPLSISGSGSGAAGDGGISASGGAAASGNAASADLLGGGATIPKSSAGKRQVTPGVASMEQTAAMGGGATTAKTYSVNGTQMTLGEYIKMLGTDPNAAYRQSVADANAAYDRQRATYGAEAEALAGQGLTGSGTSDYLDAQAYAAKQKAISTAAASRNQQMTQLAGQHATYLQQAEAERTAQIQTALDKAASMQLNESNTVKYLMAMTGMTKSEAEKYASAGAVLTEESAEDTTTATLQEIAGKYMALISTDTENGGMGMSTEAARQYLKSGTQGYDAALVDQAVNDLVGAQEQAQADAKAAQQKATAEVFEKSISTWDGATAAEQLAQLGITVTPNEKDGLIPLRDMRDAIAQAYNYGMITDAQYQSLMRSETDAAIEGGVEDKNLGATLQTAIDMDGDQGVYNYAVEKIAEAITIKKNLNAKAADIQDSVTSMYTTATFGIGVNGKTNHEVTLRLGGKGRTDIDADMNSLYADENGELYAYARYSNGGEWKKVLGIRNAGWLKKEQEKTLLDAIKSKYKKQ